jgi:hypothetical protein
MPYGRAWFLRLVIEHRALTDALDLVEFGDEVANSLRDHYTTHAIRRLSGSYGSASWALINLLDYARMRGNSELETQVVEWVRRHFIAVDQKCPAELERGHFMAVCTNWAALVARVLEKDEYLQWLERFVQLNGIPAAVKTPAGAHHFGLNFSRAWGLWDIYAKSGREDIAIAYADHLNHGFSPKSNWSGDYRAVGHWVAQFGMFAAQGLHGPRPGR